MKFGAFFFGGVEMTDAGAALPNPMDRRFDNAACGRATLDFMGTDEGAIRTARNGHDDFWKFLAPIGRRRGYVGPDGRQAASGLVPTLEESMEQKMYLVGTAEEVAEGVRMYRDLLGIERLTLLPHLIGDPDQKASEQMGRFMSDVVPLLP